MPTAATESPQQTTSTDNYTYGSSSGYSTGQPAPSYFQPQQAAGNPAPSYAAQYSTPSANTGGSSSGQMVPKDGPEEWKNYVENPNNYGPAPPNWIDLPRVRKWPKHEIAPFDRMGFLIHDGYQVPVRFMAEGDHGPFATPRFWLDVGLRLHHFTQNSPELVCKWIFTRKEKSEGRFTLKWGRVFGRITRTILQEDEDWYVWYHLYRDQKWEKDNPTGPHEDDPFDGSHEPKRAKKRLELVPKKDDMPQSNANNQAPVNSLKERLVRRFSPRKSKRSFQPNPVNPSNQAPSDCYPLQ